MGTTYKNLLPPGEAKRLLYERSKDLLTEVGYIEIGLDHFAKSESYLAKAARKGELLRNLMGHTDKKSNILTVKI